jgi:hypothetical protein
LAEDRLQLLGGLVGCGGLSEVGLRLAQLGHSFDQGYQVRDQGDHLGRDVGGVRSSQGQDACDGPQVVSMTSPGGSATVRSTGGSVVGRGYTVEQWTSEGSRCGVQRVRGCPGRVCSVTRITGGALVDVRRRITGLAGGVAVDLGAFRCGEPWCSVVGRGSGATLGPGAPETGQCERGVQASAAVPAERSVGGGVTGEGDGVAVTWAGLSSL